MLSAWRSADKLFCPRCTFTGEKYNFTVALDRYVPHAGKKIYEPDTWQ